jgi:hypothetical protein
MKKTKNRSLKGHCSSLKYSHAFGKRLLDDLASKPICPKSAQEISLF